MNQAGSFSLGSRQVTAPLTEEVITASTSLDSADVAWLQDLEDIKAASLQVDFTYGSGGLTCKVDIETSLDEGVTWHPIARFAFTTASATKIANLSGLTPKAIYAPAALSDDTVVDGPMGDRFRAKVTSTGTYAGNTRVAVSLVARG